MKENGGERKREIRPREMREMREERDKRVLGVCVRNECKWVIIQIFLTL